MSFKNKLLLDIGIALGAIVICTFVIWWVGGRIQAAVQNIDRLRSDEALRASLLTYLGELKINQEKAKPYVPIIQGLLPSKDKIIGLSNRLGGLAAQYGLQGLSFTFGAEKAGTATDPGSIAFALTVSGSSANLISFLQAIEKLDGYSIRMNSLDVTFKERVGYTLSMSGLTYVR